MDGIASTVRNDTPSFNQRVRRVSALGLVTAFEHSRKDVLAAVVDAGGTRTEYPRELEGTGASGSEVAAGGPR